MLLAGISNMAREIGGGGADEVRAQGWYKAGFDFSHIAFSFSSACGIAGGVGRQIGRCFEVSVLSTCIICAFRNFTETVHSVILALSQRSIPQGLSFVIFPLFRIPHQRNPEGGTLGHSKKERVSFAVKELDNRMTVYPEHII